MKNKALILADIVSNTDTNSEGLKLFFKLEEAITDCRTIVLSIDNNMSFSSSFLNSSLGSIIDKYGMNALRNHLKLKGGRKQFERISSYLKKYQTLEVA